MTEVFRSRDSVTIGHLQSLLESEGIKTLLRNEQASTATVPMAEITPALCILNESDVDRGVGRIKEYLEASRKAADEEVACPSCQELSPRTFELCWNCQSPLSV